MKQHTIFSIIVGACLMGGVLLGTSSTVLGAKGNQGGKPPEEPEDPPPTPVEGYYFWKLGHMDGPHDSSMALGISRDGKTAVGATDVVDFYRAWRLDIDWAIATDDGIPPLYNELQVQEDIGIVAPSQFSAAYAASDMDGESYTYDKVNLVLDWSGSTAVGTLPIGQVSYGIQWLLPVLDSVDEGDYVTIPDFGGGLSDMAAMDVSDDGWIMVGTGNIKTGQRAFRADMAVVDDDGVPIPVQLVIQDAVTEQTLRSSAAEAVSADDGLIVAGYGTTMKGTRPFVTTVLDATTDPITLESTILPRLGGGKFGEAYAMTPDGAIIAGRSDSPKGPQACIWFQDDTETWVVKGLGGLSKKNLDSVATGIAYRPGSTVGELIVVGRSATILYASEAFVWTGNPVVEDDEIGYFYDLEYILTKTGAGEASLMGSSWILTDATGISAAGDRIVGYGINPELGEEAWLITGFPFGELDLTHEE